MNELGKNLNLAIMEPIGTGSLPTLSSFLFQVSVPSTATIPIASFHAGFCPHTQIQLEDITLLHPVHRQVRLLPPRTPRCPTVTHKVEQVSTSCPSIVQLISTRAVCALSARTSRCPSVTQVADLWVRNPC